MTVIASRDLRNHTRALLSRVESGETLTIAVNGRPVALMTPVTGQPRTIGPEEFMRLFDGNLADPGLRDDLARMHTSTTDDVTL